MTIQRATSRFTIFDAILQPSVPICLPTDRLDRVQGNRRQSSELGFDSLAASFFLGILRLGISDSPPLAYRFHNSELPLFDRDPTTFRNTESETISHRRDRDKPTSLGRVQIFRVRHRVLRYGVRAFPSATVIPSAARDFFFHISANILSRNDLPRKTVNRSPTRIRYLRFVLSSVDCRANRATPGHDSSTSIQGFRQNQT